MCSYYNPLITCTHKGAKHYLGKHLRTKYTQVKSTLETPPNTMSALIKKAPAPWTCTGQVYSIFFYTRPGHRTQVAEELIPAVAFSPLERESYFASAEAGRFCGGLGGFMVIRYTETPVGPYDELLVIPGDYSYYSSSWVGKEGRQAVERKSPRITRIYVSQRDTLFNGRHSRLTFHRGVRDGFLESMRKLINWGEIRLEHSQAPSPLRLERPSQRRNTSPGISPRRLLPLGQHNYGSRRSNTTKPNTILPGILQNNPLPTFLPHVHTLGKIRRHGYDARAAARPARGQDARRPGSHGGHEEVVPVRGSAIIVSLARGLV